jgi:hypothetical protein
LKLQLQEALTINVDEVIFRDMRAALTGGAKRAREDSKIAPEGGAANTGKTSDTEMFCIAFLVSKATGSGGCTKSKCRFEHTIPSPVTSAVKGQLLDTLTLMRENADKVAVEAFVNSL